jgi:hypothetical protein
MPKLLHSVAVQERAVAADGVETFDLSVNPLSVVLLNIRPLNDNAALGSFQRAMGLAGSINRATINWLGSSVVSMSGRDIVALNYFRHGMIPFEANGDDTDNERRCLTLPILLGRFAYDKKSCLPATRRGELTMELDIDIADTGYDGFRYSVETVELLGADPSEYERKITVSKTFAATGDQDVELPIGHDVRGVLLFGTTPFGGAAPAPSWGRVSLMLNNEQVGYSSTDFEVAHQLVQLMGRQPPTGEFHTHRSDVTQASATQESGGPIDGGAGGEGFENYAYLDCDPTRDDDFSIPTKGANDFLIRTTAETADAVRAIPVERIKL